MAATSSDQDHGSLTERTAGSGDTTRNEHDNMKEEQPLMPVAVVGMSCRLSGNVSTLDEFWEMMSRARCGWSEIPEERFSKNAYHHPNPAKMGAFNTIGGYFLKQDPSMFDAPFFNITQAEAEAMDPQQRLLLECAYEAIENAGIPKERLVGKKVGVFVGGAASDYRLGTLRDLEQTPMFDATGNHQSIMSGRISHYFDLRGPSFTVDTACSSSLYALHQAVQSIRNGESEQAIVAACHWNLQPGDWVSMSLSRLFSDQGMTYAFDNRAKSGFARGEGAGALILKPLDLAIKDNDRIRSVIVNTGVNQDGRTVGITSPSGKAQEQLMREVYARAGINTLEAGFVEAHGTGTKVGDPIEATAINSVFGNGRTSRSPLYIGSVKSNVGHLENASGVISIIKATMMLEKGFVLPNTNFQSPNENIPLAKWNMKVPTLQRPWPANKRYISVNNFGFGGSNAHCVLERGPSHIQPGQKKANLDPRQRLFVVSANDEASARNLMKQLNIFIEQHPEVFQKGLLRNLAYTLAERRSQLSWRLAVVASTASDLALAVASADAKPLRVSQVPKIAFVYTGQGAQWHAMGRELLESHPVFADTIHAADACLKDFGADFSLLEELLKDKTTSKVGEAHISQPICSAVQLGLTALLASWGITPASVTGHSSGEIVAAYAAGALSLQDAMAIAYHRGQAVIKMKTQHPDLKGSMLAVGASPAEILPLTQNLNGVAVIACENSPNSITASGDERAIDELAAKIETHQLFNRKLRVDVAYHSPHMKLAASDYLEAIKDVAPNSQASSGTEFYSSLYGKKVEFSALDASYWVDNLTNPVLFSTSLKELCLNSPPDVIVEVGPHSALEGPIKQILKGISQQAASKITYFPTLSRGKNATATALAMAGNLYMKGQPLNFGNLHPEEPGTEPPIVISDLIPYPWSRQKYWSESRISQQHRKKPFLRHDLLGSLADFSNELAPTWRNVLRTDDIPWLREHKMQSLTTFPFAGFVSMAIEAAAQRAALRHVEFSRFSMREIQVKRPLLMEDGVGYEVMLAMSPYAEGTRAYSDEWDEFRICSWEQGKGWTEHCRGIISARTGDGTNLISSAHQGIVARKFHVADYLCKENVDVSTFYQELDAKGATYGPVFRKLSGIRASTSHCIATIDVADTDSTMPMNYQSAYHVHPALLDQIFQLSFPILGAGRFGMDTLYMPSAIQELHMKCLVPSAVGQKVHVYGHGCPDFKNPKATDFTMGALLAPDDDQSVISLTGLCMTPVKSEGTVTDEPRELCFKLEWQPANNIVEEVDSTASISVSAGLASGDSDYVSPVDKTSDFAIEVKQVSYREKPLEISTTLVQDSKAEGTLSSVIDIREVIDTPSVSEGSDSLKGESSLSDTSEPDWSDIPVVIVSNKGEGDSIMQHLVGALSTRTGKPVQIYALDNAPVSEDLHVILCELDEPILSNTTDEEFTQIQKLLTGTAGLLWVTKGAYLHATNPSTNMAVGLTRTVRSETAAKVATLDLDPTSQLNEHGQISLVLQAFDKVFIDDEVTDMEYSEKNGVLLVPRILNDDQMNLFVHRELYSSAPYLQDFSQASRRLKMDIGTTGALDTLFFVDEEEYELSESEVEIQVKATGMNFKDVVIAMGQLPSPYIGIECAGIVSRIGANVTTLAVGDRVCAMTEGAYSTFARCPETSATKIPDTMPFEMASSIPVVYCTAYYGLIELGRLCEGESVLIHAAAGGVGQAAIQLAHMVGAKIFATVGTPEKKKFIMDTYGIPEDCIFSSRDISFGPAIREATNGVGVDVVINSLAGEFLRETWDCVAHFGRFIEIGKRDITSNTRLEMAKFNYNATFSSVDLTVLAKERPAHMARTFGAVMRLFESSKVEAIAPITTHGISEVEKAFRLLQSGKTTGKLVVVPQDGEQVKATHLKNTDAFLHGDKTYLIIGGTGGLGRSLSRWMVDKGARTIVLLSRSGRTEGAIADMIDELKQRAQANIIVKACDVADLDSVTSMVDSCTRELPPIAGVIHAGMVLRDILFEKMSFDDYQTVIRSKVAGTWNIHNALLSTPLDFFIAISSAASIVGNRGQGAYAAANAFLDGFAQYRRKLGLPAASLNLTAVTDVGYLADNTARQTEVMKNLGGEGICEDEILALFKATITGPMASTCDNHCLTGLKLGGKGTAPDQLPYFAADAKFDHLRNAVIAASSSSGGVGSETTVSVARALARAKSHEEAISLVTTGLAGKLSSILMVPQEDLDPETPITKYGLDSLNAIELRNWITKELSTNLQVLELLTSGSLTNLASTIIKKRAPAEATT